MLQRLNVCILLAFLAIGRYAAADTAPPITRVWLTHRSNDPSRIVVSWLSEKPGDSVVQFGLTEQYGQTVRIDGNATLHHVEIPLTEHDTVVHYRVSTGEQTSVPGRFKAYPTDVMRVAVVANWQGKPDLAALVADDPHILMTAGDNIPDIYPVCGPNRPECILPYAKLVDAYPEMFRSMPFMPVLGNHDKQILPRGPAPPEEPVYDVGARAFRRFFALPDAEWRWRFDVPAFNVRFIALDFHHISDQGTTWQSSHDFHEQSEQFLWYKDLMADTGGRTVVTLYNERNASIRNQARGAWHEMFRKGTTCVTGFGHYGERAELDGLTYYDISLHGKGTPYPDPHSEFLASEHNYLLMTFDRAARTMTVEIKSLAGEVLDRKVFGQRG
jgi:hypothetical protein